MKRFSFFKYSLAVLVMLAWSSCKFDDLNVDPARPVDVPVNTLLPSIQSEIAYSHGGEFSRYSGILTQHIEGVTRQWATINQYGMSPDDMDNVWRFSVYSALMDLKQLKSKADANGYNIYSGMGRVLTAFYLLNATDHWGDMPWTEAFQGTEILQPKFDSQESLFRVIEAEVVAANGYLDNPDPGPVSAAAADLIFGGDPEQWKAFGNVVLARLRLHEATRDNDYASVLTAINDSGWADGTDGGVYFQFGATGSAPWFQFNEQRGDISLGVKMKELLTQFNDPRASVLDLPFDTDHPWLTADQSWALVPAAEPYFIKAEALSRTGGSAADIHDAYLNGIRASFEDFGLAQADIDAYLANTTIDPGEGNITLEMILLQKYIAMFGNPESFSDWRRTNVPMLTPNFGTTIPVRYPYPQTEDVFNENTPDVNIFTSKVWWDAN